MMFSGLFPYVGPMFSSFQSCNLGYIVSRLAEANSTMCYNRLAARLRSYRVAVSFATLLLETDSEKKKAAKENFNNLVVLRNVAGHVVSLNYEMDFYYWYGILKRYWTWEKVCFNWRYVECCINDIYINISEIIKWKIRINYILQWIFYKC